VPIIKAALEADCQVRESSGILPFAAPAAAVEPPEAAAVQDELKQPKLRGCHGGFGPLYPTSTAGVSGGVLELPLISKYMLIAGYLASHVKVRRVFGCL
jgi:hypothetical protein